MSEATPELKPGDRIGKYTILRTLGRGDFAKVYLAEQRLIRRKVAVKLFTTRDRDLLAMARDAMESLAGTGLEHWSRFYARGRRYRAALRDLLLRKYPGAPDEARDSDGARVRGAWEVTLEFDEIPKFQDRRASVADGLRSAVADGLLLLLWGVAAGMAAYLSFLRADVR